MQRLTMLSKVLGIVSWLSLRAAVAAPAISAPVVTLDSATFTGTSSGNTASFLGIPFAQPPLRPLLLFNHTRTYNP